jgi:ferritin-like metal-binding protein YciE
MFERLNTPEESFNYKLGAALNMEQTVMKILDANIEEAQDEQVLAMFKHHRQETEEHAGNLEEVFRIFGWEVDDSPCPAIEGLQAEGKANAKKTDASILDAVLLQGAVEVEHHEIGVYENLISAAAALGRNDVVQVLERNLRNEQETLELARRTHDRLAAVTPRPQPESKDSVVDKVKTAVGS